MEQFEILKLIGSGAYGDVYMAMDRKSKKAVALKKTKMREEDGPGVLKSTVREISLLKKLQHPNIIWLQDVFIWKEDIYIVFEYMDTDLLKYMGSVSNGIPHVTIKLFLRQILSGVAHCHSLRILHRDLKPQNLLIKENALKVADFGLARELDIPPRLLTPMVTTLNYRAPEILLGSQQYSTPIDVWSVGCIFAEMVNHEPLFYCDSEIDLLHKIFSLLGTPDQKNWPDVSSLKYFRLEFPKWSPKNLAETLPNMEPAGIDLLSKMLRLDPKKRISAKEALEHDYFA